MKRSSASRGFTLIETLIALVILAFGLLGIASLTGITTRNNASGGHMTEAATFAQDKLEEIRTTPFANINSGNDTKMGAQGIQNARNWVVAVSPGGNVKTVTLTINWADNYKHSIRMISVISD